MNEPGLSTLVEHPHGKVPAQGGDDPVSRAGDFEAFECGQAGASAQPGARDHMVADGNRDVFQADEIAQTLEQFQVE